MSTRTQTRGCQSFQHVALTFSAHETSENQNCCSVDIYAQFSADLCTMKRRCGNAFNINGIRDDRHLGRINEMPPHESRHGALAQNRNTVGKSQPAPSLAPLHDVAWNPVSPCIAFSGIPACGVDTIERPASLLAREITIGSGICYNWLVQTLTGLLSPRAIERIGVLVCRCW